MSSESGSIWEKERVPEEVKFSYRTNHGEMFVGKIQDALEDERIRALQGKVNLIFTSPPFPLVRKKRYGNESGERYVESLRSLAPALTKLLAPKGSIVLEVGNAWEEGIPTMSTLPLEALLAFKGAADLNLCQHVICHNPARLPSPAAWVTVKRCRLKDSYTHVWWMAPSEDPEADNRRVLMPYGDRMKKLLKSKKYNAGRRPSGHVVSKEGFLKDHGGAISPNVVDLVSDESTIPLDLLKFSGTGWDANYRNYCQEQDLELHPARMQPNLVAFFIQFLTKPGDIIFDPFAGSNTTGAIAEDLDRKWIGIEANWIYAEGSKGRFPPEVVRINQNLTKPRPFER